MISWNSCNVKRWCFSHEVTIAPWPNNQIPGPSPARSSNQLGLPSSPTTKTKDMKKKDPRHLVLHWVTTWNSHHMYPHVSTCCKNHHGSSTIKRDNRAEKRSKGRLAGCWERVHQWHQIPQTTNGVRFILSKIHINKRYILHIYIYTVYIYMYDYYKQLSVKMGDTYHHFVNWNAVILDLMQYGNVTYPPASIVADSRPEAISNWWWWLRW